MYIYTQNFHEISESMCVKKTQNLGGEEGHMHCLLCMWLCPYLQAKVKGANGF